MSDILGGAPADLSAVEAVAAAAFGKTLEPAAVETPEPVEAAAVETPAAEEVVVETPAAEEVVVETSAAAAPAAINPVWERALANVPELFRGPIIDQIRKSEVEAQSAIEKARSEANALAEAVPEEWRSFIETSKVASATPEQLTAAWNLTQALQADPFQFIGNITSNLKQLVDNGQITANEAQLALLGIVKQAQGVETDDALDLRTDEQKEIDRLKQEVDSIRQAEAQRTKSAQQEQETMAAQEYANQFISKLQAALPGATTDVVQTVGMIADSLIQQSGGQATVDAAIAQAVDRARQMGLQVSADPAPADPKPAPPAIAPASSALPADEPIKFKDDKDRADAMTKAALAVLAQE